MIIHRYLIREIFYALLAIALVLLLIFLSSRFARYLAEAVAGTLPVEVIFGLTALKALDYLALIFPLAMFLAVLLGFGRLYKDSEMIALAATGVGQGSLMKSVLFVALVVALVAGLLSLYASPWAKERNDEVRERAEESAEIAGIAAGRFKESRSGDLIVYVENISDDRRTLNNVFVQSRRQESLILLSSESGYQYVDPETGDQFMVMVDGYRYNGRPGDANFEIVDFERHGVRIERSETRTRPVSRDSLPSAELWGSDNLRYRAELQRRISIPVSALLLAMLAVPLSRTTPREGRYGRLFSAVLIYIIYNNLLGAAQGWVERGQMPVYVGLWWVHGLILLALLVLVFYQSRHQLWWLDRWLRRSGEA